MLAHVEVLPRVRFAGQSTEVISGLSGVEAMTDRHLLGGVVRLPVHSEDLEAEPFSHRSPQCLSVTLIFSTQLLIAAQTFGSGGSPFEGSLVVLITLLRLASTHKALNWYKVGG